LVQEAQSGKKIIHGMAILRKWAAREPVAQEGSIQFAEGTQIKKKIGRKFLLKEK